MTAGGWMQEQELKKMSDAAASLESPPGSIRKRLWVRRSNTLPNLYWWSLPLSLQAFADAFPEEITSARALVFPSQALTQCRDELQPEALSSQVSLVQDAAALLRARDQGRAGECSILLFPASRTAQDLQRAAEALRPILGANRDAV